MSAADLDADKMATGRVEDALLCSAARHPSKTAVRCGAGTLDFAGLVDLSANFARLLCEQGLEVGDRVALFQDKTIESVVALYGTWMAGGIAVPVHIGLRRPQLLHVLETASCRLLVTDRRGRKTLRSDDLPGVGRIHLALDEIPRTSEPMLPTCTGADTPAAILFTSGSTGRPKGILLSHSNLQSGAEIVSEYLGLVSDDTILSVLPFAFDYGLNQLLSSVHVGGTCVLQRSMLPSDLCRSLQENEISVLAGVPPFWIQLMNELSPFADMEFPALRVLTNSGGVFPVEVLARYREKLPQASIFLMYGFSEAFRSTYLAPQELDRRPESMGRAIPRCEVFVVDESGQECDPGVAGELVHRGPTVALGYWNDPEATARVFRPDPLDAGRPDRVAYSGDLVRRDDDGFLYFAGRRDSMLKSMGFRISPEDVEEQLLTFGQLSEVVVTGQPDSVAGARIIAHVVPSQVDGFAIEDLIEACRRNMPGYMVPSEIHVHDVLPRTPSGKFDRKSLTAYRASQDSRA